MAAAHLQYLELNVLLIERHLRGQEGRDIAGWVRIRMIVLHLSRIVFSVICLGWLAQSAASQLLTREAIDRSTVSVITGPNGSLRARLAADLAAVLDEDRNLRVLPVGGRGALSDIADILYLRGMDLAIIPTSALYYAERNRLFPSMKRKLRYITRTYIQTAHLVAGANVQSLQDLNGQKINLVSRFSGPFVTAQIAFPKFNLNYRPVYMDQRLALDKVAKGEIAATLIMSGRPSPLLNEVKKNQKLRLIPIPFNKDLPEVYFADELSSTDYPNLITNGQSVPSIATSAALMVYNFKTGTTRYGKVARFVDAFLSRLEEFQTSPRHPRWTDINLNATLQGWGRFGPAEQWLKNNPVPVVRVARAPVTVKKKRKSLKELFQEFIAAQARAGKSEELLRANKEELFKKFVDWQRTRRAAAAKPTPAKPKKAKRSLRVLFRQFIAEEVARVGKANVLALSKAELYQRFLVWRQRTAAN
ncbi:MAG: TAXI family TRAP transporter solute-binding subunit [Pseudomonadota bacterium]